jgi:ribosomal protein L11 methyltransferase
MVMLDAGTGTGILAVAASLMGVGRIDAADIVPESVENARHNAKENGCENIDIRLSDIASIEGEDRYDFIAANLLPSVIFPNIARLRDLLSADGALMVSGIGDRTSDEAKKLSAAPALRSSGTHAATAGTATF